MTWTIEGQEPWYVEHPTSPSVTSVGIAKDGVIKAVAVSTTLEDEGDYIVAALNAYEAESPRHLLVGIKPLEWRPGYHDERVTILQATTMGGMYQIRLLDGVTWLDFPEGTQGCCASEADAKEAAQADHERLIRAAISADDENLRKAEAEAFKRGFDGGVRNAAEGTVLRLRYALRNCINVMKRARTGAENNLMGAYLADTIRVAERALTDTVNWNPPCNKWPPCEDCAPNMDAGDRCVTCGATAGVEQ